ncbi:disease resistance protein RGA2-like [Cocos nucifera]|uniref:Disease resistance protein RGA2-like n=1 Tax=Cocos nucifera TaxID=13894 RepID=A0A8K0IXZ2_COCNU|nr:disease resistance protein RGA2-like [Cocos nucifera]
MAEVLLSPLLQVVIEKAADRLLQQFGAMWGIEEKLEKLERMLSAIHDILGDAEQRQVKEAGVKCWLAALKNAAYEAEDILDEFRLEAMQRKAEIRVDMRKKVRSFFSFHNPVSFRLKMGNQLKDIVEKIEEIANERNIFRFKVKTPPQNKPQTHSYVVESEAVGRKKEKDEIVKLLLDHDTNHNVAVLPIVGMGGLGKTTLAQLVYKEERVEKHFQPLIWVCVSDEFDVAKLAKKIIDSATGTECQESNLDLLQRRVREVVSGKKYLLVLDDVWNEDQAKWDELKTLLETGRKGSRIIVTARSEQVSRIMGTLDAYRLRRLSENDSWELFTKRANPPQHLESIGRQIVKKCDGLPLAVKTLGSLMHSKRQEISEWSSVRDNEIWDMQVGERQILPALWLSYSHLPAHLKQCFAFCAMFPKDYEMEKDLLIQLWMANGFVPSDGRKDRLEEKGHEIFDELASRSFFQDIKELEDKEDEIPSELARRFYLQDMKEKKEKEYHVPKARHELYSITTCKMHDLMHDLAQSIVGNECLSMVDPATSEDISTKTRHLRTSNGAVLDINSTLNDYPNIRTFVCQAPVKVDSSKPRSLMKVDSSKPRSLRALGVHRIYIGRLRFSFLISRLPISIGFLKHLRYLDVSHTLIEALPDATSTLFNLQTLKLSNCPNLHKLPEDMRNMRSLRHLYIDRCRNLKQLPAGIGQLSSLRTLTKYIVGNDAGRRIVELNRLNLSGFLELYNLRNVRDAADAKEANLSSKHNLRSLIFCWDMIEWDAPDYYEGRDTYYCPDVLPAKNAEEVLEALRPHGGVKLLAIWRYGGGRFPTWMMDAPLLQKLVEIHLGVCTGCEHLPPLWQLPLLKFLYLIKMDGIKHICSSTIYGNTSNGKVQAFPSLKRLVLHKMQSLKEWSEDESTAQGMLVFPNLAELKIINCPNLMTIPELPSLKSLKMKGTNEQLGLVRCLTTLSSLEIEVDKTSNGTESPPLAQEKMSFRDFRSLENLRITASEDLAPLLKEEEDTKGLSSCLHHLYFSRFNGLFPSSQQASSYLGFWKNLTSLLSLSIHYCDDLVKWPEEEFRCLSSLKTLDIWSCEKLVARLPLSSSSSGDGELLPNLEELHIGFCSALLELPKLPASLRSLKIEFCDQLKSMKDGLRHATALDSIHISNCSSLESLPEGFGQLTALKYLDIIGCSNLSSLPEGMQGLTALQKLEIWGCPQLSSLPEGLQQRLSGLQMLVIKECPNLERQYARGGPYWDLISHIPDTGTLSERRSNFSTFLPSFSCL